MIPVGITLYDNEFLDQLLLDCYRQVILRQKKDPNYWGLVGACILDQKYNVVFGVNHAAEGNTSMHAERVALNHYLKKYHSIGPDSVMITTLSPCILPMADRYGASCCNLIEQHEIAQVYCGYIDPRHSGDFVYPTEYILTETTNIDILNKCRELANCFL